MGKSGTVFFDPPYIVRVNEPTRGIKIRHHQLVNPLLEDTEDPLRI
jgi:hypothetical protein